MATKIHQASSVQNSLEMPSRPALRQPITPAQVTFASPKQVQTKLTVNTPGDKYELEADRVADQVMRVQAPESAKQFPLSPRSIDSLQRQPDENHHGSQFMVGAGLSFSVGVGSQNIGESASIRLFGAMMDDSKALEAGIELAATKHQRVFGIDTIKHGDYGLRLKWTIEYTGGHNQGFVGVDSGSPMPLGKRPQGESTSWSLGVSGDYVLKMPDEVKSLENQAHSIQFGHSKGELRQTFSTDNDLPFSDKGRTAGAKLALDRLAGDQVQSAGLNFSMITPAPTRLDQSRRIRGSTIGTYETDKSEPYHGNWFLSGSLRTKEFRIDVELGADSIAGGRVPQDVIHKYFLPFIGAGESPLFEWPDRKTNPYWNLRLEGGAAGTVQRNPLKQVRFEQQNAELTRSSHAGHVMRMRDPKVQRQCACGKSSPEGECSECKKKKHHSTGSLQRVASSPVGGITAPLIVNEVLSSPGSPLPTSTRTFMESRFGQDFSHVRVHTDQQAAESAAAVQARAYTVDNNIVFGQDESPTQDPHLLAHELTHVLQQGSTSSSSVGLSHQSNALQRDESKKEDKETATGPEQEDFKKRVNKSETYRSIIDEAFRDYSDPAIKLTVDDLVAMIAAESSGNANVTSGKHRGLFQLSRDNTFDSPDMAKARKARFNKTTKDKAFSWDDKGILDPTANIRYGVFVVIERRRQAQASIDKKAQLEIEQSSIEEDRKQLEEDRTNIPIQLGSEKDESKKAELRKKRGELRGRGKDLDIREKENTEQLKVAEGIDAGNIKLKEFIAKNPAASSYLLHQQGVSGLRTLLERENEPIENNQIENLPDAEKKTIRTKRDFVSYWVKRYEKFRSLVAVASKPKDAQKQIQPKLKVNTPGDKYEQEADHVAGQVMRMPEPQVKRQCACGKSSTDGECSDCKKKKQEANGTLQRFASSPIGGIAAPPIVNEVVSSPGSPLPASTRSFMESRFGQDFSHVRVHTDQRASKSAAAIHARAYTVGNSIVFGRGESPSSDTRLLAHELTHVIQQTSGNAPGIVSRSPDPTDLSKIDGSIISKLRKVADDWMSGAKNLDPMVFSLGLDLSQFALDIIGVVEPTPVADAINTGISAARGDWWGAGFSALGMIPYVGDLAKAGKLGAYAKSVTQAIELASKSPQVAKLLRPVMEILTDSLRSTEKYLPSKIATAVSSMRNQLDTFLTKGISVAEDAAVKASDEAVETVGKALDSVPNGSTKAVEDGAQSLIDEEAKLISQTEASSRRSGQELWEQGIEPQWNWRDGNFRSAMGTPPTHLKRPVAHHDLPVKYGQWFHWNGIDINDSKYGRWIEEASHQKWSNAFEQEWAEFIATHRRPSQAEILSHMNTLRQLFK